MTHHILKSFVTGTSMLRAGLLALLLISFLHPTTLHAAPIVLKATFLENSSCDYALSGDNFSLYGQEMGGCGGQIVPVGIGPYEGLVGTLSVPENPGRYAVVFATYQPSLYKEVTPQYVPRNFTGPINVNVILSGSLQVCLAHAGITDSRNALYSGCDPQFTDFGVININVAGVARFYADNGNITYGSGFIGFAGTSAAAPEPAHLGSAAGAWLLLLLIVARQKRRKARA